MKFVYGKNDWRTYERGQESCYLLTNGLGGFSSQTMIGSNARNDQALFMPCTYAPTDRYHMVTRFDEFLTVDQESFTLSSQEYVNYTKNKRGYQYQQAFSVDIFPVWIYQCEGVEIRKTIAMQYGENTIGIQYCIDNRMAVEAKLTLVPQMQFVEKGKSLSVGQVFEIKEKSIVSNDRALFYKTNGLIERYDTEYVEDMYYEHDARDGREAIGKTAHNHRLRFDVPAHEERSFYVIYSMDEIHISMEEILEQEKLRQNKLMVQSDMVNSIAQQLVSSADQYIVERASTKGKTIIAGYPFFGDWGRDTMIALVGCCISTKRFEDAKSIFRTFMEYCKKGIMPNMFPEGENAPLYNTVDASLLFISAVYEYYLETKDNDFVKECWQVMKEIIDWYQEGTDFHIRMDEDGLIQAGGGFEQVTWMDVRFGEILPTPRHGKPVEINAYWYNDLKVMEELAVLLNLEGETYGALAQKVKQSFSEQFWNEKTGCLKDVISGTPSDEQIRCNQIWAVSQHYTMLSREQEKKVVDKVFEKLYTPYGLRSLCKEDKDFKPNYNGSHFNRDMAYHQGTVWGFPLGGYYLAYLKVHDYSEKTVTKVKEQLQAIEGCMREGCIGQIAEIYDGENPAISQGCFAQAWSVSEILRVFAKLEG